ncbi:histidine phosphatase family protein [Arthrobacter sp. AQ5-05]|uniref:histidine phosphatase family protein n=1 Tax=Arthrobacter sp. AQ5-05 TaxID=2184581 RepID=UPI000DCF014B|nr:histidine phosphatase family protein [Arthrobacter sp. AQ5-05]RAX49102.1 histidine phosphatase family protein [Arthrobacter sp. AQ5-05]
MSATLVLVRHGETAWNAEGRLQGQTDIPLNDLGREQAHVVGQELGSGSWDVLVSSSLERAVETAELIGQNLGLALTEKLDGLQERNYGQAEGELVRHLPRERIDQLLQSAEPEDAVATRGLAVLHELIQRHEGRNIIAVAHGTLIRLALDTISGGPSRPIMRNGEVVHVDVHKLCEHFREAVH